MVGARRSETQIINGVQRPIAQARVTQCNSTVVREQAALGASVQMNAE